MKRYARYFDYERDLGRGVVSPFLRERGLSLDGGSVLDVGCGEGGVLAGLAEGFSFRGLGIDYDEEAIRRAQTVAGCRFEQGDFYAYKFDETYDFILVRDVLEHCGDADGMLKRAAALLSEGGRIYVTYTPYPSPFGGHQHNGSGPFSNVPYLQVLPEALFLRLIQVKGNWYKGSSQLSKDLRQIRRTRLTTGAMKRAAGEAGLTVEFLRAFVFRPDYRYRFGLPTLRLPSLLGVNTLTDIASTGVEVLLRKQHSA
jgi:SAM-dependent methyltransferase